MKLQVLFLMIFPLNLLADFYVRKDSEEPFQLSIVDENRRVVYEWNFPNRPIKELQTKTHFLLQGSFTDIENELSFSYKEIYDGIAIPIEMWNSIKNLKEGEIQKQPLTNVMFRGCMKDFGNGLEVCNSNNDSFFHFPSDKNNSDHFPIPSEGNFFLRENMQLDSAYTQHFLPEGFDDKHLTITSQVQRKNNKLDLTILNAKIPTGMNASVVTNRTGEKIIALPPHEDGAYYSYLFPLTFMASRTPPIDFDKNDFSGFENQPLRGLVVNSPEGQIKNSKIYGHGEYEKLGNYRIRATWNGKSATGNIVINTQNFELNLQGGEVDFKNNILNIKNVESGNLITGINEGGYKDFSIGNINMNNNTLRGDIHIGIGQISGAKLPRKIDLNDNDSNKLPLFLKNVAPKTTYTLGNGYELRNMSSKGLVKNVQTSNYGQLYLDEKFLGNFKIKNNFLVKKNLPNNRYFINENNKLVHFSIKKIQHPDDHLLVLLNNNSQKRFFNQYYNTLIRQYSTEDPKYIDSLHMKILLSFKSIYEAELNNIKTKKNYSRNTDSYQSLAKMKDFIYQRIIPDLKFDMAQDIKLSLINVEMDTRINRDKKSSFDHMIEMMEKSREKLSSPVNIPLGDAQGNYCLNMEKMKSAHNQKLKSKVKLPKITTDDIKNAIKARYQHVDAKFQRDGIEARYIGDALATGVGHQSKIDIRIGAVTRYFTGDWIKRHIEDNPHTELSYQIFSILNQIVSEDPSTYDNEAEFDPLFYFYINMHGNTGQRACANGLYATVPDTYERIKPKYKINLQSHSKDIFFFELIQRSLEKQIASNAHLLAQGNRLDSNGYIYEPTHAQSYIQNVLKDTLHINSPPMDSFISIVDNEIKDKTKEDIFRTYLSTIKDKNHKLSLLEMIRSQIEQMNSTEIEEWTRKFVKFAEDSITEDIFEYGDGINIIGIKEEPMIKILENLNFIEKCSNTKKGKK